MKKIMAVALSLLMLMTALQIASFAADYVDGRPNHLKLNSGVTVFEGLADGSNPKSLVVTFGDGGNATVTNDNVGCATVTADNTLKLTYHELWEGYGVFYGAGLGFPETGEGYDYAYVRAAYKANNAVETSFIIEAGDNRHFIAERVTNTNGKFVLSDTTALCADMVNRMCHGIGAFLYFSTNQTNDEYEIKALYFFQTREEADAFEMPVEKYNDNRPWYFKDAADGGQVTIAGEPDASTGDSSKVHIITFGEGGNATLGTDTNSGKTTITADNTLKLEYNSWGGGYAAYMANFTYGIPSASYRFVRVEYKATDTVTDTAIIIENNSTSYRNYLQQKVVDTNGEFVLSDVAVIAGDIPERLVDSAPNNIYFSNMNEGGEYEIKAIYFFETREAAENFTLGNEGKNPSTSDMTVLTAMSAVLVLGVAIVFKKKAFVR